MANRVQWLPVLACGVVLFATGCATTVHRQYSGESLPRPEVARIVIQNSPIETSKLDGKPPTVDRQRLRRDSLLYGAVWFPLTFGWPGLVHWAMNLDPRAVEVLPGEHVLEVWFSQQVGTSMQVGNTIRSTVLRSKYPKTLQLDAVAGRKYRVNGKTEGSDWSAYVEDVTDKEPRVVSPGAR